MALSPDFLRRVSERVLVALCFLLPVFFLPWTSNILETNKQTLLVFFVLVALAAWLGSMVMGKRIERRGGLVVVFPLLFLGAVLGSSVLSMAGYQTWVGQSSQEYTSFLTLASCVAAYYVIVGIVREGELVRRCLYALLFAAGLASTLVWVSLFGIPLPYVSTTGFNTVGTVNTLIVFLSTVSFIGMGLWLVSFKKVNLFPAGGWGVLARVALFLTLVTTLVLSISVDYWTLWLVDIVGILVLCGFGVLRPGAFPDIRRFALPLFFLFVCGIFLVIRSPLSLGLPVVVSPSFAASTDIAKQTLSQSVPRVLFGSGPGTYTYDYARFKPADANATAFWNFRFDRAKSHLLTVFTTMGVVGTVTWLLCLISTLVFAFARLARERDAETWGLLFATTSGWIVIASAHLLYASNMTLTFLFWVGIGLIAAQTVGAGKEIEFGKSPRTALLGSFGFVLASVGVLVAVGVTATRYVADASFARAALLDRQAAAPEEIIKALAQAANLNPLSDLYQRNLASVYLGQAQRLLAQATAPLSPEQQQQVSSLVGAAVTAAKKATDLGPFDVANWSTRGAIYRDVMPYVQNAEDYAAATYQQAVALDPRNPALYVNLGRVYLSVADRARGLKAAEDPTLAQTAATSEAEQLKQAENAFNEALKIKQDYAPAHYYLAATFEREGRLVEAVNRIAALSNASPNNVSLLFQLAMLHLRQDDLAQARVALERAVNLAPTYSNALWFLASLDELDGRMSEALALVQKVAELNPDDQQVATRLEKLQRGEKTVTGSNDVPAPVEEVIPPEAVEGEAPASDTGATLPVTEGESIPATP